MPTRSARAQQREEDTSEKYFQAAKTSLITHRSAISHVQRIMDADDALDGITEEVVDVLSLAVADVLPLRSKLQKTLFFKESDYKLDVEIARWRNCFGQAVRREAGSSLGFVKLKAKVLLYIFIIMAKMRSSLHPLLEWYARAKKEGRKRSRID